MRFWDTSALFPLFVAERVSPRAQDLWRHDPHVAVWTVTRVELLSALARRRRENRRLAAKLAAAREKVLDAWSRWSEISAIETVVRHAARLVEMHPLRTADALQIGAALVAARDRPAELEFVTFDERQAEAAEHEGFRVLGPR